MSSLAVFGRRSSGTIARADSVGGSLMRRNAVVRRMLLAALVSTCGDRLHQVGLAALILGMTNSMAAAGFVFVMSALPYALFGLPVGVLIDRWDRRTAMIGADVVRGVLVLGIPLAAVVNLPIVYGLLFCLTCATMIFTPARQAALPGPRRGGRACLSQHVVPGSELPGRRGCVSGGGRARRGVRHDFWHAQRWICDFRCGLRLVPPVCRAAGRPANVSRACGPRCIATRQSGRTGGRRAAVPGAQRAAAHQYGAADAGSTVAWLAAHAVDWLRLARVAHRHIRLRHHRDGQCAGHAGGLVSVEPSAATARIRDA